MLQRYFHCSKYPVSERTFALGRSHSMPNMAAMVIGERLENT